MTVIKATCPHCGDVELTVAQVRLVVCSVPEWSYYAFVCASCGEEVRKVATPEIVGLLTTGGVLAERWSVPAEVLEVHVGEPVGYDDVLDFALSLARTDLLAALASFPGSRVAAR
jgi:predicted RNA-binding Zn-ribbon protein involved in translation (DUF1610 family)